MRVLVALLLTAVSLAGCASDDLPNDDPSDTIEWVPGPGSHPAYGLPVTEELPLVTQNVSNLPAAWRQPVGEPLPETITSLVPLANAAGVESGAGIAVFGSLAFVGAWNQQKLWSVDISQIDAPQVLGMIEETNAGDIDTIAFPPTQDRPDGRLILVVATRGADINVIDATDPANMTLISTIRPTGGNHNLQVVPGTPLLYNAQSGGEGALTAIWDLSDPENPIHVKDWNNGYGCHAVDFFINATLDRFYGFCAGIEATQVFDVLDPLNPVVLSTAPWPVVGRDLGQSGAVAPASFSHLAVSNHDGTVMIVGDETGGGAAPGCDFGVRDPVTGTTVSGPLGNLYFYDITDPREPVLHGHVSPNAWEQRGSCTAHFGGVIEDRNQLVMAYYTLGVALIDFSDIDNPYVQDLAGRNEEDQPCTLCGTWDAWVYRGHVLTGDIDHGLDVLTFA